MRLSQLSYNLPKNLIANSPSYPRDHSKLLIIDRETESISHKHFYDLSDIVGPGDVLVLNDTKVFPARAYGKKKTGGTVEVLFLKEVKNNVWEILGKNIPSLGEKIYFINFYAKVVEKGYKSTKVRVFTKGKNLLKLLEKSGHTPLPPYIDTKLSAGQQKQKYQTVYAEKEGSVAAPTAGLHFTKSLLSRLKKKGVVSGSAIAVEYVTLHVGAGTFLPIKEKEISKHKMHSEYYSVSKKTFNSLVKAKKEGKRIIAVGTTTTRVLETIAKNKKLTGETNIYIYPPYKFKFVDALITNFHLPHSTLLALVSAFVSSPNAKNKFVNFKSSLAGKAYKEAISKKYRFYSFGDASLII